MIRTANLIGSVSRKAGGLHQSVRRLVQSLSESHVGVRVLTLEDEFTHIDLAEWQPVDVDVFPTTWPQGFGYSPGFLRVLREYRPNLTHTHGIWMYPSIATAVYCTRSRVPYMISPHGMLDPWAVRHHRWKKVLAYAIFETNHVHGARCLRALCESEARSIRQLKLANPVAVIPNGVDLPPLNAGTGGAINAPWSKLVEPAQKVLLFLGRIHPKKGLTNLLNAWAQVFGSERREHRPAEWVLAIAGWDQSGFERILMRQARDLGLAFTTTSSESSVGGDRSRSKPTNTNEIEKSAAVLFLGPTFGAAKEACYRACDAFVLPSLSEGLPMAVLEAWSYAKPVLITPECNLPEGFASQAAIRIDVTTEGIAEGLRTLCSMSSATLEEIGHRGRNLVEGRFTWPSIASQVKRTYEWMLGGGPKPSWMWNNQTS